MKKILYVLIISLVATNISAQGIAKVGTSGYQFLKIGASARGIALGNAVDPIVEDASAVFWNPARLTLIENYSIFLSHQEFLADIKYESFAFARNFPDIGVIGLNFIYLNSGDIEETSYQQQSGTGNTFSAVSYAVGISFARMLTNKFAIGGNIKYVNEDLTQGLGEDNATSAWAVDLGTVYYPGFKNLESLCLSMSIRNFGPEVQLAGTYNDFDGNNGEFLEEESEFALFPLPLNFRFGIGYDPIDIEQHKLSVVLIGEHPNDNEERLNIGAEYIFNEMFALRGGYIVNHDSRTFSAGIGTIFNLFNNANFKLDYGYAHYGVLEAVQHFSISFDW